MEFLGKVQPEAVEPAAGANGFENERVQGSHYARVTADIIEEIRELGTKAGGVSEGNDVPFVTDDKVMPNDGKSVLEEAAGSAGDVKFKGSN